MRKDRMNKILKTIICIALALSVAFVMMGCESKEEKAAKEAAAKAKAEQEAAEAKATEEAEAVDALIDQLGEADSITLKDKENIEAARIAYDALSDDAKAKVTKLDVLEACESKYEQLKEEKKKKEEAKKEKEREEKEKAELEAEAKKNAELEAQAKAEAEAKAKAKAKAKAEKEEAEKKEMEPDDKTIAGSYIGKNIESLIKKIGSPKKRTIQDGCYDGGRDLIAKYDGFSVYAHAKPDSDKFIITEIE